MPAEEDSLTLPGDEITEWPRLEGTSRILNLHLLAHTTGRATNLHI